MALKVNSSAPDFLAFNDENQAVSLKNLLGKWTVLYFYPKDNTSGCTKEACSFEEHLSELSNLDTLVIGVSPDSVKSHINFKKKYNLHFMLLADPDKSLCELYDVLGEKSMYGKKYIGVVRTTYLINPEGKIVWVNPKVTVEGHTQEILNAIKDLQIK